MVREIKPTEFDKVINKDKVVVVKLYADWCQPCKALDPIIDKLDTEIGKIVEFNKLNVDNDGAREIAIKYGISAVPTLLIFKDGVVYDTIVGVLSKDKIKNRIFRVLKR